MFAPTSGNYGTFFRIFLFFCFSISSTLLSYISIALDLGGSNRSAGRRGGWGPDQHSERSHSASGRECLDTCVRECV